MDKYVAFIPVRGGSKSIPLKNIKKINGRPLVYWTLDAAVNCKAIQKVYLCTDNDIIRESIEQYRKTYDCADKLICIDRPDYTATDTASTESVMEYFVRTYDDFKNIILIQATSPLLRSDHLDNAIESFETEGYDSLLSVVRQKRFHWACTDAGYQPTNYDFKNRPRRQEFDGYLVENGAFYINSRAGFLKENCRLDGRIGVFEMEEETYFEIDEPSDWIVIEHLLSKRTLSAQSGVKHAGMLSKIKILLTDCDGVLTDGGMYYSERGDELKKFNTRDGMGVALLHEAGIKFGIITGEKVELVNWRAKKLKADECHTGISNKCDVLDQICTKYGYTDADVAYIGDDINDVDILKRVGFSCSVADASDKAQEAAQYITKAAGGQGVVREVAEIILRARGK